MSFNSAEEAKEALEPSVVEDIKCLSLSGHQTALVKTERTEKRRDLKEEQRKSHQRIQEKQKKVQELKQAVNNIKSRAQAAVENNERIFTDLIIFMEKKCSEVTELIRDQEKAELNQAERLLQQWEQEIADLKSRVTELEKLSHTHDHIHFLQHEDSFSIAVNQNISFDGVTKSLSHLKEHVEKFCEDEIRNIPPHAAAVQMILPLEPKSRKDFLQYFCHLILDPNTAHHKIFLFENNKLVKASNRYQPYSDHPERFDCYTQVLSKESVSGRCYWEVEWRGDVFISVSYKEISRKGEGKECGFGFNNQSWSLLCSSSSSPCFYHNNIRIALEGPSSSRIGVYVDHSAGTLFFYSISDTTRLLHRVQTKFTHPLYAGFGFGFWGWRFNSTARLCCPK